jgi:glucose/arabinose dehydrogenase/mono/diheme cytochrome c family protein
MLASRQCRNIGSVLAVFAALSAGNSQASPASPSSAPPAAAAACPQNDSGLKLPPGFCASIFADGVGHARHLVVAPDGVVYLNPWAGRYYGHDTPHAGGFLVALRDTTGAGKADVNQRFGETVQSGGAGGTGIGLHEGALFAEINDKIVRYTLRAGSIVPQGPAVPVVTGLPLTGDHPMHPFTIDAKGSLYIDVATPTNACQEKNRTLKSPGIVPCAELETRGGIWRYDANKTNQAFSPAGRFATGIRNAEGFAIDAAGRMFVTQHGRDQLHANWPDLYKPEEEATQPAEELLLLKQGGDYGWPECYYDGIQGKLVLAPEYGGDGGKTQGVCAGKIAPIAAFPAHWAPNAMALYDKTQFPAHYRHGVFIAFHGSWDRAPYPQSGYNVVFQALAGDHASGQCEIFADGFAGAVASPGQADHRPSGLAVGPDGALFVSDDVRGRIYRIVYRGGSGDSGAPRYTECPSPTAPAGGVSADDAKPPEGTHADAGAAAEAAGLPVAAGATRAMVVLGDRIYHGQVGAATCTGCHGSDAKGTPLGPDLTDTQWLWSDGSYPAIAKTITDGVPQPKQYRSPMPAMGGAPLTSDQVSALAAYIWGLSHRSPTTSNAPAASGTTAGGGAAIPAQLAIPGRTVYPESLTSTADGTVIIGSIGTRTIFRVKPGSSTAEPWIGPGGEPTLGVYGVFADDESHTLWACFSSVLGSNHGAASAPSALHAYDLTTGKLKASYPLPTAGAFCNDIAVGADGATYATDSNNMQVVRLGPGAQRLEVWAGGGAFGPPGGILDGISILNRRVFVNALNTSRIFSILIDSDGSAGTISEVLLSRPIDRPDGMRRFGRNTLLLIEGGGAGRLSRLTISGDSAELTTLKEGFPDGPVSVAVVGTTGYVLEGQLKTLFGADPAATAKPFHATAVAVGAS